MERNPLSDWIEPVLVLTPTGRDAAVAAELMHEVGAHARVCSTPMEVAAGLARGAAALVIASEALQDGGAEVLSDALLHQPAWSDIPVILLTLPMEGRWPDAAERLMASVGNITLLERPFRAASFTSVLTVALRARRRQFEVHRLLASERKARERAAAESRRADARERELRGSEERFRLIANSIPQLAWMAEPNGRLFWFNERWYQFSGAEPGNPRAGWAAWLAAQDANFFPAAERQWRYALAHGVPFDMEFPMRGRDGDSRWFLTRAVPATGPDGSPTLWFGTCTDITEQRETAQALRQSEERLLLAVETAQLGLWSLDPARQQLRYSETFRAQMGREQPNLTYEEFWSAVRDDHRAELEERVRDAIATGGEMSVEYPIVTASGEERWILARARAVPGTSGAFVALMGVSLEITERKRDEQRRESVLAAERAARSEAERVARMKDEFLATLSHELRTPLNAVIGWAEVLQRAAPGSADFERGVNAITRNARLQAQLIEDLLDTSRIVSGTLDLDLATVEMSEIVDSAIESLQPALTARRIHIARNYSAAVRVRGDRRRLQQVVWNLLSNAVKFSPSGGIVQVVLTASCGDCALEVRDQGQGMDPAFLPFLFERFRQQDSSRTRRSGGLGLGLSIVKQIVQLHGGSVTGTSEGPGTGAVFRVALPCLADTQPMTPDHAAGPRVSGFDVLRDARILVVDDEPDARDLVARILRQHRATVLLAASAEEALAKVRSERPDLIISDIGMPARDGFELIQDVRALLDQVRDIPALALTAFARAEDQELALRSGFQRHLGKPVDSLALVTACADLLAGRASADGDSSRAARRAAA